MPPNPDQDQGNRPEGRPVTEQAAAELRENFDGHCEKAAEALAEADILLLVTGAGFSADSGLAVFGDVAKVEAYRNRGVDYSDLCQPKLVDKDPGLFFGFWGQAFNDYRKTKPHRGYDIIARWRDDKNGAGGGKVARDIRDSIQKKVRLENPFDSEEIQLHTPYTVTDGSAGAFHVFTSNADAHFYDQFQAHEIHDCHGSVELWQCSSRDCTSGIWRAPLHHAFVVDSHTMLAPQLKEAAKDGPSDYNEGMRASPQSEDGGSSVPRIGRTKGIGKRSDPLRNMPASKDEKGWRQDEGANWPKCGHCGSLARPAIFMFGDFGWKYDMSQSKRWDLWTEAVLDLCGDVCRNLEVCIMEIGCGLNVPTCRTTSEQLVEQVLQQGGDVKLVRINPDFPLAPRGSIAEDHLIPIMSRGLQAVEQIDKIYRSHGK